VLGHLPVPDDDHMQLNSTEMLRPRQLRKVSLAHRISDDPHHGLESVDELAEVLDDLEADGYVSKSKDGWKMTKKGFDALTGPIAEEPAGPPAPALIGGTGESDA
jgi:hypothetical protein